MKKFVLTALMLICVFTMSAFADSALGNIVFKEDFETLTNPKSGGYITAILSSEFGGGKIPLYNGGVTGVNYSIDSPVTDGSKMLYVYGNAVYPQAMFPHLNLTKPGVYTLVYDYYIPDNYTLSFLQSVLKTTNRVSFTKGSIKTVTETYEIKAESGESIPQIGIQSCKSSSAPAEYGFYLDNVTLYYLAPQPDYGLLIAAQDFEKSTSLEDKMIIPGSKVWGFGSGAEFSREVPSGISGVSTMLKVNSPEKTAPAAGYTNLEITRPGTYTVTFDYYMPSDYTYTWFQVRTNIKDVKVTPVKGSLNKAVAQFSVLEGQTVKNIYFQAYNGGKTINNSYYIDNVKLYLVPEKYVFSDFAYNLVTTFIGDAETERGFAWTADKKCDDMAIRYATSVDALQNEYTEAPGYYEEYDGNFYYKADVTDLEAGTKYFYMVGDRELDVWSEAYCFETEASDVDAFSFVALTDPQGASKSNYDSFAEVLKQGFAKADDAKFVVTLGDLVELGYMESYWKMYFDAFEGISASVPNMAVLGNHESRESVAGKNFRLHFNNPNNGHNAIGSLTVSDVSANLYKELVQNIKETVYSFDYGNVHLVVLNTGSDWSTNDGKKFAEAQKVWLEADLAATDAEWKIVMLHQGLYPAKKERYWGLREIYEKLLCDMDVDLVLQGHDHMVARTYPMLYGKSILSDSTDTITKGDGIVYFIPGAAADKRYTELTEIPEYMLKVINTESTKPSYSVVSVDGVEKLSVETFDVTGELLDSFEIVKKNYFKTNNKNVDVNVSIDRTGTFIPGFAVIACKDKDGRITNTFIRTLVDGINDINFEFSTEKEIAEIEVVTMSDLKTLQPSDKVTVFEKVG